MRVWILRILALNLIMVALWFGVPLKSPATQALKQQDRLIELAAKRKWTQAFLLFADDYQDDWDMKREEAISVANELFQGFLILDLEWKLSSVSKLEKTVVIKGFIKASGSGAGFSSETISRLNNLHEPFVFTWRKDGWKPGDWRLVGVAQSELAGRY